MKKILSLTLTAISLAAMLNMGNFKTNAAIGTICCSNPSLSTNNREYKEDYLNTNRCTECNSAQAYSSSHITVYQVQKCLNCGTVKDRWIRECYIINHCSNSRHNKVSHDCNN